MPDLVGAHGPGRVAAVTRICVKCKAEVTSYYIVKGKGVLCTSCKGGVRVPVTTHRKEERFPPRDKTRTTPTPKGHPARRTP